mmetsp:Transcript_2196/g.1901  ORF Transcript_2196/g.1901 Transcript_2196/m.1901 type:complete len:162 (-) Transcript_2196:66-551(-)
MNKLSSVLLISLAILLSFKSVKGTFLSHVKVTIDSITNDSAGDEKKVYLRVTCYGYDEEDPDDIFFQPEDHDTDDHDIADGETREYDDTLKFNNDQYTKCYFQLFRNDGFFSDTSLSNKEEAINLNDGNRCDTEVGPFTKSMEEGEWEIKYYYEKYDGRDC